MQQKTKAFITALIFILIPLIAGTFAGIATATSVGDWYLQLEKPSFNPPNYLFGPVWSVLYILMGISSYLIYLKKDATLQTAALIVYGFQLALNISWSFLFFYYQNPAWALADIVILWFTIIIMIYLFWRVDILAGWLQVPYLLWVTFATVLNAAIWWLN